MKLEKVCILFCVLAISRISAQQHHQQQPPPQHHQQQQQQPPPPQQHQQPPPQQQQHHQQPPPQQQQHHQQQQQQQHHQQQQQVHQQQQQQPPPGQANHQFGAENEVRDEQHIKEHLEGQVNVDQKQMTNEQLQFHYFSMHDLNKDNMLDGIELSKAITHWHGAEGGDAQHQPPRLAENELEDMIDSILKDDDYNGDGYIDYMEFVKAQSGRMAG